MLKRELEKIKYVTNVMKEKCLDSYIVRAEEDIWYLTNITYKPEERPFFLVFSQKERSISIAPKL